MKTKIRGNEFVFGVNLKQLKIARRKHAATQKFNGIGQGIIRHVQTPSPTLVTRRVGNRTYRTYRKGLDSACADCVITTTRADGIHCVLAIRRKPAKAFGGSWWMQGGALHAYRSMAKFAAECGAKESGVKSDIEAIMFTARTCAPDKIASTFQPCFVSRAKWEDIQQHARPDGDHSEIRLFTLAEIEAMSAEELHWYPRLAFELALKSM